MSFNMDQDLQTIELPASEFFRLMKDTAEIHNLLVEIIASQKVLPQKQIAEASVNNMKKVMAEPDPITRFHMLHAYIRSHIKHISEALKARPPATGEGEEVKRRAITKVMLRAQQLVEYTKQKLETAKERIQVTSIEARTYLAGQEGRAPNRRDAIKALQRASQIFPALSYGAVPNDRRGVKRLTLEKDHCPDILTDQDKKRYQKRQAREDEIKEVFFKQEVSRA